MTDLFAQFDKDFDVVGLQKDIKEMQSMDGYTRIQSDIKRLRRELSTLHKMLSM